MSEWREGARRGDPRDKCPNCKQGGVLTFDFTKFGKHKMAACDNCNCIFVDGKLAAKVEGGKP